MNAKVEAGSMIHQVIMVINEPTLITEFNISESLTWRVTQSWTCPSSAISINGHSLNAINPDFSKVGELTTLVMA